MFVNYSNHPSSAWGPSQLSAAEKYGEIIDLPFLQVDPNMTSEQVRAAAAEEVEKILQYHPDAVMCQGEMTLLFNMITILKANGVPVVAATSERKVSETLGPDGTTKKNILFEFVRFREY